MKGNNTMKISILSMQRVVNYGSVLQAWSLRQMVQRITGREVGFLDIQDQPSIPVETNTADKDYVVPADYPPGILQKAKRKLITKLSACTKRKIRHFMDKELGLNRPDDGEICDCVIVGSDEVFNHAKGVRLQLHGQIPQTKKAFTYAASCGNGRGEDLPPADRERVAQALNNFSEISVRDRATEEYVKTLSGKDVQRHLDPVLVGGLAERTHKKVGIKKYLLVYAYGQRIRTREEISAIRSFAKKHGLRTVAVGGSQFWCDLYLPADPMRMLDYFYYADYVVTDTFHGAVFSVINRKQFAVLPRNSNAQKVTGLLEDLKLHERMAEELQMLEKILEKPVDYGAVDRILQVEKDRSYDYLKKQLGV